MADKPPIGAPPIGGPPRVLSPATHARYESAVRYVENLIRTRPPRPNSSRFPGAAWRAWGLLEPGETITGRSGLTLGEGDVQRYQQDEADLVDADDRIHVYNFQGEVKADSSGDGLMLSFSWNGGYWHMEPLGLIRAQAPVGGIGPGDTETVTLYGADHAIGSGSLSAANRTTNAVAGSAMVLVAWMAREGEYQVVNEVCG